MSKPKNFMATEEGLFYPLYLLAVLYFATRIVFPTIWPATGIAGAVVSFLDCLAIFIIIYETPNYILPSAMLLGTVFWRAIDTYIAVFDIVLFKIHKEKLRREIRRMVRIAGKNRA